MTLLIWGLFAREKTHCTYAHLQHREDSGSSLPQSAQITQQVRWPLKNRIFPKPMVVTFAVAHNLVPAFILLVGVWAKVTKRKMGYSCIGLHKNYFVAL